MDIMDTARLNIKRHREWKGLRQQDMADKLNMNVRSYQNLETGVTKLDLERLEQIADILEVKLEDLLKQEGVYIHQEIQEIKESSYGFVYHQEIGTEVLDKLLAAKDKEIQHLVDANQTLKEEVLYLKEKLDQLLGMVGRT